MSTFTGTTEPALVRATRPAGPESSPALCICLQLRRPIRYSRLVSLPLLSGSSPRGLLSRLADVRSSNCETGNGVFTRQVQQRSPGWSWLLEELYHEENWPRPLRGRLPGETV